jgi:DNA-binding LacI/PurR family transcriptional regulator/signal transduction histidine kinase
MDDYHRPVTIGVILGSIGELYQAHIWPGILDAAKEHEVGIIVYSGKIPHSPTEADREEGVVYGLPDPSCVDGVILLEGVLSNFMSPEEKAAFIRQYEPLPIVSIAGTTEGVPSVIIDNKTGMRALVEHFIKDHGYRRIAFIRGPERNQEASERFQTYRETLEKFGIQYDDNLVTTGDFLYETGAAAARQLLDERHAKFDAIIAANDGMLFGALSVFRERGIAVPGKIAVGGFDDVDETRVHSPPITTVAQPLYTIGKVACNLLLNIIDGREVAQRTLIPSHLIIRRSCGCEPDAVYSRTRFLGRNGNLRTDSTAHERIVESFETLLEAELSGLNDHGDFIDMLTETLESGSYGEGGIAEFASVLDVLAVKASKYPTDRRIEAADIIAQARYVFTEFLGRATNWRQFSNKLLILQRMSKALSSALSAEGITTTIENNLAGIGVREFYIAIAQGPTKRGAYIVEPPERSLLMFAYCDGTRIPIEGPGISFRSKNLTPDLFLTARGKGNYIVFPLMFRDEFFGFMVVELTGSADSVFAIEYLHDQLAGAIKALKTLEELKFAKEQLMHSERMAALGELTAGIAHELKNPLNFITNFAEGIGEYLDEIEAELGRPNPLSGENIARVKTILADARKAQESIVFHGQKAERIIKSMLNQARGDAGKAESVSLNVILRECVTLAQHSAHILYPRFSARVEEQYDESIPRIMGKSGQLNQAFSNLMTNAFYSMRKKSETADDYAAMLTITTGLHNGGIYAEIRDNGTGMSDAVRARIFQPFFTTKPPNEGTGLGLKICREIIEEAHHGRISVETVEGEYTSFSIWLPLTRT